MHFLPEKIEDYVVKHSEEEPKLLQELARETYQKVLQPIMLSGAYQGRLLSLFSKLVQPNTILEIGTFTGYATLCLAEGLQKKGTIHTIDNNEELVDIQKKYFDKSPYTKQIQTYLGNALDILPTLKTTFDLVFIDADKENYYNYFNAIINSVTTGGIIISDNVLWHGKVVETAKEKDATTKALQKFNTLIKEDTRVKTLMLPVRDGLTICRKIE